MTEIIRAEPDDAGVLSAVIAEAFFDLPPSQWLISDEASRRKIFPAYFRIFVEHALAQGIVHTTPDRAPSRCGSRSEKSRHSCQTNTASGCGG